MKEIDKKVISSKIRFPVIVVGVFVAAILAALYFATFGRMAKADPAESIQLGRMRRRRSSSHPMVRRRTHLI